MTTSGKVASRRSRCCSQASSFCISRRPSERCREGRRRSVDLARAAFAGAVTGMAGMTMAIVMISSATTEGGDVNPTVTRAIASASAGPFLLSAMGFAALLIAAGLLTLHSRRLRALDRCRCTHRRGVVSRRVRRSPLGLGRGQHLRLRLLPRRPGARDLVDRHERCELSGGYRRRRRLTRDQEPAPTARTASFNVERPARIQAPPSRKSPGGGLAWPGARSWRA